MTKCLREMAQRWAMTKTKVLERDGTETDYDKVFERDGREYGKDW